MVWEQIQQQHFIPVSHEFPLRTRFWQLDLVVSTNRPHLPFMQKYLCHRSSSSSASSLNRTCNSFRRPRHSVYWTSTRVIILSSTSRTQSSRASSRRRLGSSFCALIASRAQISSWNSHTSRPIPVVTTPIYLAIICLSSSIPTPSLTFSRLISPWFYIRSTFCLYKRSHRVISGENCICVNLEIRPHYDEPWPISAFYPISYQ